MDEETLRKIVGDVVRNVLTEILADHGLVRRRRPVPAELSEKRRAAAHAKWMQIKNAKVTKKSRTKVQSAVQVQMQNGTELSTGKPTEGPATSEVWRRYSVAYKLKYGEFPPRNAKVNGQLARLLSRVPAEDAGAVAEYYLTVDEPLYRKGLHPVDLLLRDAEKLHTLWRTKAKVNGSGHDAAAQAKPWWEVWSGIEKMGEQLGVKPQPDAPQTFKAEVYRMAAMVGELPQPIADKLGVRAQ